jgi:hypothetical protein
LADVLPQQKNKRGGSRFVLTIKQQLDHISEFLAPSTEFWVPVTPASYSFHLISAAETLFKEAM